jgi:hypothetical protein
MTPEDQRRIEQSLSEHSQGFVEHQQWLQQHELWLQESERKREQLRQEIEQIRKNSEQVRAETRAETDQIRKNAEQVRADSERSRREHQLWLEEHERKMAKIDARIKHGIRLAVREARAERAKRRELDEKLTQLAASHVLTEEALRDLKVTVNTFIQSMGSGGNGHPQA